MVWHQPFDLYYWFVNVFAGSLDLFLAISFFLIAMLGAMFRMPTIMIGIFFALFIIMLSVVTGTWFVLIIMVAALAIGWSIVRLLK